MLALLLLPVGACFVVAVDACFDSACKRLLCCCCQRLLHQRGLQVLALSLLLTLAALLTLALSKLTLKNKNNSIVNRNRHLSLEGHPFERCPGKDNKNNSIVHQNGHLSLEGSPLERCSGKGKPQPLGYVNKSAVALLFWK